MPLFTDQSPPKEWSRALDHLLSAIKILDETQAPSNIAPHLDLAISRLEEALGRESADNSARSLHQEIDEAFVAVMAEGPKHSALVWD